MTMLLYVQHHEKHILLWPDTQRGHTSFGRSQANAESGTIDWCATDID
jgi:hypothetical protein